MSSFIELVRPQTKIAARFFDAIMILLGSCFIAVMAQISIPLWFTPIPITMQTFALFLLAALLGSKRGMVATLLYLAEGAMGLPVFANFGGGLATFLGPKAGYLVAFPFCVYLIGWLLERGWRKSFILSFVAMTLGSLLVKLVGVLCLAFFVGGMGRAFALGFTPFIIGDFLKILAACAIIPSGWRWLAKE